MEENNYPDAKEMFLLACTYGSSPLSWLGLGTACFMVIFTFMSMSEAMRSTNHIVIS